MMTGAVASAFATDMGRRVADHNGHDFFVPSSVAVKFQRRLVSLVNRILIDANPLSIASALATAVNLTTDSEKVVVCVLLEMPWICFIPTVVMIWSWFRCRTSPRMSLSAINHSRKVFGTPVEYRNFVFGISKNILQISINMTL